jgi:hypothetical protein
MSDPKPKDPPAPIVVGVRKESQEQPILKRSNMFLEEDANKMG